MGKKHIQHVEYELLCVCQSWSRKQREEENESRGEMETGNVNRRKSEFQQWIDRERENVRRNRQEGLTSITTLQSLGPCRET